MRLLPYIIGDKVILWLSAGGIASTVEPYLPYLSKNPTEIQIIVLFVFLRSLVSVCFLDIYFVFFVHFVL